MGFNEDMFALLKTKDWTACHRRIDDEPGKTREQRVSAALWRAAIFKWEERYDDALRTLEASRFEVFSQCGYLWKRAEILCRMGRDANAIETLQKAPFGEEIDTFPAMAYEAIFLYCYLLQRSGREPPANLVAALPDDFTTRTYDGKKVSKADILPPVADIVPASCRNLSVITNDVTGKVITVRKGHPLRRFFDAVGSSTAN